MQKCMFYITYHAFKSGAQKSCTRLERISDSNYQKAANNVNAKAIKKGVDSQRAYAIRGKNEGVKAKMCRASSTLEQKVKIR